MTNEAVRRRKRAKGRWMRLRDAELLANYMKASDFSQARLGRYAQVSRQFINQLLRGERRTCTREVGQRIEEALRVLPGTLFVPKESLVVRRSVSRNRTSRAVA